MTVLGVALLLALAAAVALAATWGARHLAGTDPLDRAVAGALAGLVVVPLVGCLLGVVGLVRPVPALLALLVVSTVLAIALHRDRGAPAEPRVEAPRAIGLLCIAIGVAALAVSLRLGFDAGRSTHFESEHYHFAAVAQFRWAGTIWTLPFQNPSVFSAANPTLSELTTAILSFTTDSDRLIYGWIHASSAVLAILGGALLVRELGGRPASGALAAMAVLLCPLAIISVHSISSDLLPVAGLTAAIALVLRARAPDAHRWTMACAGVALGVGLGSKYTVFVGAALVVVAALVVGQGRRTLWLVPGAALLGGPWLVRNLVSLDNPLYPQPIRLAGVELFEGGATRPQSRVSSTVLGHLAAGRGDAMSTWVDLVRLLCWPLAIAAAVGALLVLPRLWRRDAREALAAAILGLGLIVAYLATPYTGGGVPPLVDIMGSNLRYALPALTVGVLLLVAVLPKPADVVVALALVGWSVWRMFDSPMRADLEITTSVLAMALAVTLTVGVALGASAALRSGGGGGRPHQIRWLVWAVPIALVVAAVVQDEHTDDESLSPLEAAVVRAVGEAGAPDDPEVAVLGVIDLRSVAGGGFEREIEQVTDVLAPAPFEAEELDRDLAAIDAPVLVIGHKDISLPRGYEPSEESWCPSTATTGYTVYHRRQGTEACRSATGAAG